MVEQEENKTHDNGAPAPTENSPRKHIQSEIEFPYTDLETVGPLVVALHNNAGGRSEDEELAGWLNQSADGGTYRARRSAARMFGLIEISQGRINLTSLGQGLAVEGTSRSARAEAFLKPELYAAMYEKHRGTVLPPSAAIERLMEQLGVSPKQKGRARQAFQKSAAYAGYIDGSTGRFIKPGNNTQGPADDAGKRQSGGTGSGSSGSGAGGDDGEPPRHPLIEGLFQSLPTDGEVWTIEEAADWLQAAAYNLRFAYKIKGGFIKVEVVPSKAGGAT